MDEKFFFGSFKQTNKIHQIKMKAFKKEKLSSKKLHSLNFFLFVTFSREKHSKWGKNMVLKCVYSGTVAAL